MLISIACLKCGHSIRAASDWGAAHGITCPRCFEPVNVDWAELASAAVAIDRAMGPLDELLHELQSPQAVMPAVGKREALASDAVGKTVFNRYMPRSAAKQFSERMEGPDGEAT